MIRAVGVPNLVELRPANLSDLDAIVALELACFSHGWSKQSWADQIRDNYVAVATFDQVIGALAMRAVVDTAEVLRIMVTPGQRRTGVGQALMEYGHTWAQTQGAVEVFLEVSEGNQAAIGLYESLGFHQIDRRINYYGPGDDALVYRFLEVGCLSR